MRVESFVIETVTTREYVITLTADEAVSLSHLLVRWSSGIALCEARLDAGLYPLGEELASRLSGDGIELPSRG